MSRFNFSKDKKNQHEFYLSPILCSCSRQPCSLTSLAAVLRSEDSEAVELVTMEVEELVTELDWSGSV